jgi:membrane-bound lytic murein transglycosylase D
VQAGDTLSEIAERNGVDVQQIRDWNKMGKKSTIRVGQNLVLDQNAIQNQKLVHKVKSGETLSEIAYQHGVEVKQLMQWNGISSAKSLKPNQELNIWLGSNTSKHKQYIVQNGDNLWVIAKEFELSVDGLAKYNQITKKTLLRPGQILKIPFKTI